MLSLLVFILLVCGASMLAALVLRRAGLSSNGILAGLLVGVLAGPTVLGRLAPDRWEATVMGATDLRQERDLARSERTAYAMAASSAETDPDEVVSQLEDRDARILQLDAGIDQASRRHGRPWAFACIGLAAIALGLGWSSGRRPRREGRTSDALQLSLWIVLLPGVLTVLGMRLLGRPALAPETLFTAIAVSVPGWSCGRREAGALARIGTDGLVEKTLRTAMLPILAATILAAWSGGAGWGVAALVLLVLGTDIAPSRWGRRGRRRIRSCLHGLVLPSLAAIAVLRSDLLLETPWILAIVLVLVAGDGRMIAWLVGLGFTTPGNDDSSLQAGGGRSWRTSLLASAASGPQLALAATASALALIDSGTTLALVLGAATLDATGPIRSRLAAA